jgi:hypothetical protein
MTVFEFTCRDCGSFEVVPVGDLLRHLAREPSFRCPECSAPVSVDVLSNFEPSDDAWFSALQRHPDPDRPRRALVQPHRRARVLEGLAPGPSRVA